MSDRTDERVTVLLRHDLPDGSWHVDWMIEQDETKRLLTFRLPYPLDELTPSDPMRAERIGDHRRLYLKHEGPLPGPSPRGSVRRLARGIVRSWSREEGEPWLMRIDWTLADGRRCEQMLRLEPRWGFVWAISDVSAASSS